MKQIIIILSLLIANQFVFSQTNSKANISNGTILVSPILTFHGANYSISKQPYDLYLIGVYFNDNTNNKPNPRYYKIPIKTKGITQVKYNQESGMIKKGDPITSSSVAGEAMKATESGMILGIALEDANNLNGLVKIRLMIQYMR